MRRIPRPCSRVPSLLMGPRDADMPRALEVRARPAPCHTAIAVGVYAQCAAQDGHLLSGLVSTLPSQLRVAPCPFREHPSCGSRLTELRTGQGVQKVGMLTPWIEAFPATSLSIIQEVDHIVGYKLSDIIQHGPGKVLNRTPNAQPAIMATSLIILHILEHEFGFKAAERADFTLGHSLGEFAALFAGGYLELEDSLFLVQRRAEVMAEATQRAVEAYGGEYGMVAIVTAPSYLQPLISAIDDFVGHSSAGSKSESAEDRSPIDQVLIANINSRIRSC